MIEMAPRGSTNNDRRRLWCNNESYYSRVKECYTKKLEMKQRSETKPPEQVTEEQLKRDTLRAMVKYFIRVKFTFLFHV